MNNDLYFMSEAYLAARKSKDIRTQVGAVLVGPDKEIRMKAYNGPCRGIDEAWAQSNRELKTQMSEHAERNITNNCARIGASSMDCTLFVTMHPCGECARGIVQSGIKEVVIHKERPALPHFDSSFDIAKIILEKGGVILREWTGKPLVDGIMVNGETIFFP